MHHVIFSLNEYVMLCYETTEHRSFVRVEEGSLSRTPAFAQEEYAMKREREKREERGTCLGGDFARRASV